MSAARARARVAAPATRREASLGISAALLALPLASQLPAGAKEDTCESCSNSDSALSPGDRAFTTSPSGLRYQDIREGSGASPSNGQTVVVEWTGYTAGYQAKRIESTRETETPFVFKLGAGQAIPAFEEAVSGMKVGGVRRLEIPGELEEQLGYSRDKALRYAVGPEPTTFGGKRALDFVLDNRTLKDFNRTLLFDVRLANIRG